MSIRQVIAMIFLGRGIYDEERLVCFCEDECNYCEEGGHKDVL